MGSCKGLSALASTERASSTTRLGGIPLAAVLGDDVIEVIAEYAWKPT